MKLDDGRLLEANKLESAWIVRVDNVTLPDVYETTHLRAFEKAKEILGVKND